jgi:Ala-tRNA(Pro) deacylase
VYVFIDSDLKNTDKISFHPNINTATLVLDFRDFECFLNWSGNEYEFVKLYD